MAVTYELLWAASPPVWQQSAAAWRELAASGARRAMELASGAVALAAAWSGAGADAAISRLRRLRDDLEAGRLAQLETAAVLTEHAAALRAAKARLAAAVRAAEAAGLAVERSGRVVEAGPVPGRVVVGAAAPGGTASPAGAEGDPARGVAVAAEIRAALSDAEATDAETAARLGELSRAAEAGWESVPPVYRPGGGATPAAVRAWWDSLTPAQRRWLMRHEPTLVGGLDGLPVTARDLANRALLELALEAARLGLPVDGFHSGAPGGVSLSGAELRGAIAGGDAYARDATLITSLERLAAQVSPDGDPPRYLVRFDPRGDGRAVVAVGDPDRSASVLTYVPGMTSDLASFGGELERAARVAEHATELDPARRTAAVVWLDYDAPDFVDAAVSDAPARDAAPALHRFQEGLRAGHEGGEPARQTVLGHSYGSLVAGVTARDHGLDADGLVLLASPGAGVDHAARLGVPEVWASTSITDPIQRGPVSPVSALTDALVAAAVPGPAGAALAYALPEDDLWHGRNPADPDFGARLFASQADAGHVGYWERGGTALDALSRIALGLPPGGAA